MREQNDDKIKILEALKATPVISMACAKTGIARATLYRWLNSDPEFKQRVNRAIKLGNRSVDDLAYGKLIQKIKDGSLGAITFYLSRRHQYFKKKEKVKVEIMQKNTTLPTIPQQAFNEVSIGKLAKKIRKRVVKRGVRLYNALQDAMVEMEKKDPEFKLPMMLHIQKLPWGVILKNVLEEEKHEVKIKK